eukprot:CAMPEP_0202898354 /NCGR_PEP_ID=MMETSP1392-20130828/6903_1 /ASSEMBLY_ACC=CAM_ASM_000868 /TAXON_ID=225041 /ORGANISM="Chlamydomonas chlamydogama, Strain SAG 11-48b" /LENGTH=48 /DNA_ID= /DNA_START= /DNA_END= /DNA_ORIENTATION=
MARGTSVSSVNACCCLDASDTTAALRVAGAPRGFSPAASASPPRALAP